MIVDREGDLVLTDEDNLLRLDVGGFLMLATGEEIEQRMPQRQALRWRQMDRAGFKLGGVTKRAGTLHLLDLTEPPQPDCCAGR